MEIFVHAPGQEHPEIVDVEATGLIGELLADADGHVWLEDVDEELDPSISLKDAGVRRHHHVHRGHCPRVDVVVRFNGGSYEQTYGPGATIKKIEKWIFGAEGTNLSAEQAAKHVLAEPGGDHFLEAGVHVGSLVKLGSCTVVLDLLPRARFEG